MKINKNHILILYLLSLLLFIVKISIYIPRPYVSKLSLNSANNKDLISRISSLDTKPHNRILRKIKIGNSFKVVMDQNISFQITSIAFALKDQFSLSNYVKYFPELIIEADDINFIDEKNNFGVQRSSIRNQYQSCLLFNNYPFLVYEIENEDIKHKYNDYTHWFSTFKREF